MNTKRITVTLLIAMGVICLPATLVSQEQKKGRVQITVTGGTSPSPIKGADVLVRSATGDFQETDQTNSRGVCTISKVPQGTLLVQIAAPGWRTNGSQHVLNGERLNITINLVPDHAPATPSPSGSASPPGWK